jgi:hypothetical protein
MDLQSTQTSKIYETLNKERKKYNNIYHLNITNSATWQTCVASNSAEQPPTFHRQWPHGTPAPHHQDRHHVPHG